MASPDNSGTATACASCGKPIDPDAGQMMFQGEWMHERCWRTADAEREAAIWNDLVPVGSPVCYWPGFREGDGIWSNTRTKASVLGGHTAVVWVEGRGDCIALTHVEVRRVAR